jgi:COP9 signalosome complex subunit 2
MSQLLNELYTSTQTSQGEDLSQKSTQLMEIYAIEIQMHNETRNHKKLKVTRGSDESNPDH